MKKYTAPWSRSLIVVSSLATLICVGAAISVAWSGRPSIALLPLAIIGGGILFTIRGYTVTPDTLLIHRLLWRTRLPLAGLHSAQVEPEAMRAGASARLVMAACILSPVGFATRH